MKNVDVKLGHSVKAAHFRAIVLKRKPTGEGGMPKRPEI